MDIVTKHIEEYYGNIPDDADKVEAAKHFYEQAEKDTIERTESHLESVLPNFLDMDTAKWIIKDFKKAMEED